MTRTVLLDRKELRAMLMMLMPRLYLQVRAQANLRTPSKTYLLARVKTPTSRVLLTRMRRA